MSLGTKHLWSHKCPKKWDQYTLIALVITVIVLLILAGVTIATLTGDNGLLTKAGEAKNTTESAAELEKLQLTVQSIKIDSSDNLLSKNILEEKLENTIYGENNGPWIYKGTNSYYKINIDGSVVNTGNSIDITSNDFGKSVDYGVKYTNKDNKISDESKWQILYADIENVYLISKDSMPSFNIDYGSDASSLIWNVYISNSGLPYSSLLNDTDRFPAAKRWMYSYIDPNTDTWYATYHQNERKNIQSTMYLLDSKSVWNIYKNEYADWVIGGPTLEMMVESSNKINKEKNEASGNSYTPLEINGVNALGYPYSQNTTFKCINNQAFWIAAPSKNSFERICWTDFGFINGNNGFRYTPYFRPVVCLNSNVKLNYNSQKECYTINY